jgi:hypothetical protein
MQLKLHQYNRKAQGYLPLKSGIPIGRKSLLSIALKSSHISFAISIDGSSFVIQTLFLLSHTFNLFSSFLISYLILFCFARPAPYISLAKSRGEEYILNFCSTIKLLCWHRQTCYYSLPSPMS